MHSSKIVTIILVCALGVACGLMARKEVFDARSVQVPTVDDRAYTRRDQYLRTACIEELLGRSGRPKPRAGFVRRVADVPLDLLARLTTPAEAGNKPALASALDICERY